MESNVYSMHLDHEKAREQNGGVTKISSIVSARALLELVGHNQVAMADFAFDFTAMK